MKSKENVMHLIRITTTLSCTLNCVYVVFCLSIVVIVVAHIYSMLKCDINEINNSDHVL